MDVSGINNTYSNYLLNKMDTSKVTNKMDVNKDATDEELMDACKSFESYFMEKIFSSMMESTKLFSDEDNTDSYASQMVDYFKDTAVQALTEASAKQGGVGIAKQLFEQMKIQNSGIDPASLRKE